MRKTDLPPTIPYWFLFAQFLIFSPVDSSSHCCSSTAPRLSISRLPTPVHIDRSYASPAFSAEMEMHGTEITTRPSAFSGIGSARYVALLARSV